MNPIQARALLAELVDSSGAKPETFEELALRFIGKDLYHLYIGPFDKFFANVHRSLAYRSLRFERNVAEGEYQGAAVNSYSDENVPFTRIAKHKQLAPWETHERMVYFKKYCFDAGGNDVSFYPISLTVENEIRDKYWKRVDDESCVSFWKRLGTYRYPDMDVTIGEALSVAKVFLEKL